jgi:hypothetical protein
LSAACQRMDSKRGGEADLVFDVDLAIGGRN